MIKLNRAFLVPYLQNLCAIHLAKRRLANRYSTLKSRIDVCRKGKRNPLPASPDKEKIGGGTIICFALGIFFMSGFFTMLKEDGFSSLTFFLFMCMAASLGIGIWNCYDVMRNNEANRVCYSRKMQEYDYIKSQNAEEAKKIPALEAELRHCEQEMNRIDTLLRSAYEVNIIPRGYRDVYTALYLNEWFSTGISDDLDHALSMFVLEEIKDRLDTVIRNQSEQMLNQRIMIANQYKSMDQQEAYARDMRTKLSSIQATMDEQLYYERMIESEIRTTAYFVASDYIKRL